MWVKWLNIWRSISEDMRWFSELSGHSLPRVVRDKLRFIQVMEDFPHHNTSRVQICWNYYYIIITCSIQWNYYYWGILNAALSWTLHYPASCVTSLETSYHRNCCNPTHDTEQISTVQGALSTRPTILSSSAGCRPVAQWQRGDTRPAGEGSNPGVVWVWD